LLPHYVYQPVLYRFASPWNNFRSQNHLIRASTPTTRRYPQVLDDWELLLETYKRHWDFTSDSESSTMTLSHFSWIISSKDSLTLEWVTSRCWNVRDADKNWLGLIFVVDSSKFMGKTTIINIVYFYVYVFEICAVLSEVFSRFCRQYFTIIARGIYFSTSLFSSEALIKTFDRAIWSDGFTCRLRFVDRILKIEIKENYWWNRWHVTWL